METITLETIVEEMVEKYPQAIDYGIMNGVRMIFCVGAFPTTLGELLSARQVADPQQFVDGLNEYLREQAQTGPA